MYFFKGIIFGIISCIIIVGTICISIYYYGIRYGMIRHFARRLGLTNQNNHIEDNQLLNHISANNRDDI